MTKDDKSVTRGMRCHQAMGRIMQVLTEEFQDLGPPELVFILVWLKHRYMDEMEAIVRERPPQTPAHAN